VPDSPARPGDHRPRTSTRATSRDSLHAAIAPERLLVTPNGRLLVVEYVMGAALEQVRYTPDRYWHELRIAVPKTTNLPASTSV
jgi:hypothetical protein